MELDLPWMATGLHISWSANQKKQTQWNKIITMESGYRPLMEGKPGLGLPSRGRVSSHSLARPRKAERPSFHFQGRVTSVPSCHHKQNWRGSAWGQFPSTFKCTPAGFLPAHTQPGDFRTEHSSAGPDLQPRAMPASPDCFGPSQAWPFHPGSWAAAELTILHLSPWVGAELWPSQ